jgi:hypothetical protein
LHLGGQTIRTTAEHPFYVQGRGWVAAGELSVHELLVLHDGRTLPVQAIRLTAEFATVYNFRVAEHHTYFVGDCDTWGWCVWVHNTYTGFKSLSLKNKIQYLCDRGIEGADELLAKMNSSARNVKQGARYHAKRAVNYYLAGKLDAIEHGVNGGSVDILLRTKMQVEAKSWWNAASIGKERLGSLEKQIGRYLKSPTNKLRVEFQYQIAPQVEELLSTLRDQLYGKRLTWKQT